MKRTIKYLSFISAWLLIVCIPIHIPSPEIETKHDTRWKSNTFPTSSDSEGTSLHPINRHTTKMTKENTGAESSAFVPLRSLRPHQEEKASVHMDLPPNLQQQKYPSSHGDEKSDSDDDTLALIKEIGSALSVRPHQEQHTDEETDTEQGGGEGKVKYFVNKIEQNAEPLNPPRKIVVVENHSDDGTASVFPAFLPENPHCARPQSEIRLDLGFIASDSSTDDVNASSSSNLHSQNSGDSSEQSVVRHLVGRFEEKSPEEDFREVSDSGNSTFQLHSFKHENSSQHSPRNVQSAGREETDKGSFFPSVSKGVPSTSLLSKVEESALTIKPKSDPIKHDESAVNPSSFNPSKPYSTTKSQWRKYSHSSAFQVVAGQTQPQTLIPPSHRPRPKSADQIHDSRYFQEGEGAYSVTCLQTSSFHPDSSEEEKSGTFLRQVSEEGRKMRKLHGKSHPLSKLGSAQLQTRKGPFHNSM